MFLLVAFFQKVKLILFQFICTFALHKIGKTLKRYFIYLAYNGKNFCGWQVQPNGPSIQATLEDALATILRSPVTVTGAGRTDAGVHAKQMVAHFDREEPLADLPFLTDKLNRLLPKEIAIHKIISVKADAHARFDAIARTYKYYVTGRKDPFNFDQVLKIHGTYDFDAMNQAANALFDYIDFTSFSKLHTDVKTNNCRIYRAGWQQEGDCWVFTIQADRFLRNMVRAIVGTLLEVGRGTLSVAGFRQVVEAKDRGKAGTSVPGHALYLAEVIYPATLFNVET